MKLSILDAAGEKTIAMDRSVSLPNSFSSNGVSSQSQYKLAKNGGSASLRKKVSWVPDTVDNEDISKKSFKKEQYVSSSSLTSSSDMRCVTCNCSNLG